MSDITSSQQQSQYTENEEERRKRRAIFWWWPIGAVLLALILLTLGGLYYAGYIGKKYADKSRVDNAFVFRIDGKDTQGRKAAFDYMIFTDEYTWVKGSASQVTSRGQIVSDEEVAQRVISTQILQSLNRSTDIIAVGLASQEGDRKVEEDRANQRSRTISGWMSKLENPSTPLWYLNLGQYNKGCKKQEDEDTSFERPIIMAGVRSKDNGVNIQQALVDAISDKENLPSRECYSKFDLVQVH